MSRQFLRRFSTSTIKHNKTGQSNVKGKGKPNVPHTNPITTNTNTNTNNVNVKPIVNPVPSIVPAVSSINTSLKQSSIPTTPIQSTSSTIQQQQQQSLSSLSLSNLSSYHYLPIKPISLSNDTYLPVSPIKPSPVDQLSLTSRVTSQSQSRHASEPIPRWLLVFLALSVPFAVFARNDGRALFIERTESFIDWPEWFRVHDLTKIDHEFSNDKHIANMFKSNPPTKRVESHSNTGLSSNDKQLPQSNTNAAAANLAELRNAEISRQRELETPGEREARIAQETERQNLLDEITRLEAAIRTATSNVELQVAQEIERAENDARAESLEQVKTWASEMKSRLDERLLAMTERVVAAENDSFSSLLDAAVEAAREQEINRGVESIQQSLRQAEQSYEQATRALLTEDGQRFASWAADENRVRESLLARNRAAFEGVKHEFDDLQDYLYLSSNIHRVNLAVMAIEEALSNDTDASSQSNASLHQWSTLIGAGHSDPVIGSAVRSLSNEALENGLASYDELQKRWKQSEFSLFTAAYDADPTHSSLPTHIFGLLAAIFTIKSHDLVSGQDDISRLQRCGYWIDHPDLDEISSAKLHQEVCGLSEKVRHTIDPSFLRRLAERAAAEVAVTAIKARIQTLEIAFIPADN